HSPPRRCESTARGPPVGASRMPQPVRAPRLLNRHERPVGSLPPGELGPCRRACDPCHVALDGPVEEAGCSLFHIKSKVDAAQLSTTRHFDLMRNTTNVFPP